MLRVILCAHSAAFSVWKSFLSDPPDTLITMRDNTIDKQPAIDPYDQPVAFLARYGLEAELVSVEEPVLPTAA